MSFLQAPRRRPRKAIILDVDGTLVDSNDAHARAWVDAFTEAGILVDREQVRRSIGMGGDKLMPHVSGISEESPEGARISARRAELFKSRYLPDVRAFDRIRDLVRRFVDDGFTVVVASSAKDDELDDLLERAGVADLISRQTSSDDAESSKPDPDIVTAALRRAGVDAADAVMLGDTPYDVEAARRAGLAIVGVESGGWLRDQLVGAVEVYGSPAELLERYDQSIIRRMQSDVARQSGSAVRPSIDLRLVAIVAAGVAGLALLLVAASAYSRRRSSDSEETVFEPRAGLSPRERARLRQIISRTF